ncbi:MAG: hypothetical protein SF028_10010 [Candidatus Sumerlaeia bacterium]|nr:hypothetical protein [Candidatus Sumerlaeia bacterium]
MSSSVRPPSFASARTLSQLAALALCGGAAVVMQGDYFDTFESRPELFEQRLRLLDAPVMRVMTLGFKDVYVDYMFLKAIQGLGSGWIRPEASREGMYNYFDKLSDLERDFPPLYAFGNLVVADQGKYIPGGQKLLRKGVEWNRGEWQLAQLGIYNAIWLANNPDDARWFVEMAKRMPEAPEFVLRFEEYIERRLGKYDAAFDVTVDYFVRYSEAGNEGERELLFNRLNDIFDQWNLQVVEDAMDRFFEEKGFLPQNMEELLAGDYFQRTEVATMAGFISAVEMAFGRNLTGDEAKTFIQAQSRQQVDGLPPDPKGTWYFLSSGARIEIEAKGDPSSLWPEDRYAYVASISSYREVLETQIVSNAYRIKNSIVDGKVPDDIRETYEVADGVGGHFYITPDGEYRNSTLDRLVSGGDPRLGARGRGPFPLPLEPSLNDFQNDFDWAQKKGLIDAQGNLAVDPLGRPLGELDEPAE